MKEPNIPESSLSDSPQQPESEHKPYLDVGERLRSIREWMSMTQDVFATKLGVSKRTIINYEQGIRLPEPEALRKLLDDFAVNPEWLLSGYGARHSLAAAHKLIASAYERFFTYKCRPDEVSGAMTIFAELYNRRRTDRIDIPEWLYEICPDVTDDALVEWSNGNIEFGILGLKEEPLAAYIKGVEQRRGDEFVYVPRIDAEVSAGPGAICEEDQVRDRLAFRKDWVRYMGLQPECLALVSIRGDSMEPTFLDGDLILVNLSVQDIQLDGIYVLRRDGFLIVKRVQTAITGDVYIRSDNPRYTEERIPRDRLEQLRVVGRAVWLCRQI
jgi:transcriptional regulator with XRE-family HTH domain/SOS-response transcriptional repressor LexA